MLSASTLAWESLLTTENVCVPGHYYPCPQLQISCREEQCGLMGLMTKRTRSWTQMHFLINYKDINVSRENDSFEEQSCNEKVPKSHSYEVNRGWKKKKTWLDKDEGTNRARIDCAALDNPAQGKGKHGAYTHTWGNREQVETIMHHTQSDQRETLEDF